MGEDSTGRKDMMSSFRDNRLTGALLAMNATPEGIASVAAMLINAPHGELTEEVAAPFVEELFRIVLDWMAVGEQRDVRQLLTRLRETVRQKELVVQAREAPIRMRLYYQLEGAGLLLTTFLRTNNLARDLGQLAGVRRRAWRDAIQFMHRYQRPVMRRDLVKHKIFKSDKTAHSALLVLVRSGLVGRVSREGNVLYELTWSGRSVARAVSGPLIANIADHPQWGAVPITVEREAGSLAPHEQLPTRHFEATFRAAAFARNR
jgi:hypothetical protein